MLYQFQCLVHALKMDDILLGDKPLLPAEGKIKDRIFDPETDTDWKSYWYFNSISVNTWEFMLCAVVNGARGHH